MGGGPMAPAPAAETGTREMQQTTTDAGATTSSASGNGQPSGTGDTTSTGTTTATQRTATRTSGRRSSTATEPTARRSTRQGRGARLPTFAEEFPGKGSTTGQCAAVDGEIMCYQNMHEAEEVERTRDINVVTAMSSSADPDTMYYHEAMKQPDRKQFVEAVKKEFGTMVDNGLVEIVPKSEMPEGANLFPAVWAMKRKRRVLTGEVYKYKARMNLDGSKQ